MKTNPEVTPVVGADNVIAAALLILICPNVLPVELVKIMVTPVPLSVAPPPTLKLPPSI
jgi:hypothetical protein